MLVRKTAIALLLVLASTAALADGVDQENLTEYGTGIISDYSDMSPAEPIEWAWTAPQLRLADYAFKVAPVENLTSKADADMEDAVNDNLGRMLQRSGSQEAGAPVLDVRPAIYWADRANRAKMWIPYAGGHLAQAGVGIELVFTDASGAVVAKLRHSGREGDEMEHAAEELIDDVQQFVESH